MLPKFTFRRTANALFVAAVSLGFLTLQANVGHAQTPVSGQFLAQTPCQLEKDADTLCTQVTVPLKVQAIFKRHTGTPRRRIVLSNHPPWRCLPMRAA
jgi:hypothetical protein